MPNACGISACINAARIFSLQTPVKFRYKQFFPRFHLELQIAKTLLVSFKKKKLHAKLVLLDDYYKPIPSLFRLLHPRLLKGRVTWKRVTEYGAMMKVQQELIWLLALWGYQFTGHDQPSEDWIAINWRNFHWVAGARPKGTTYYFVKNDEFDFPRYSGMPRMRGRDNDEHAQWRHYLQAMRIGCIGTRDEPRLFRETEQVEKHGISKRNF